MGINDLRRAKGHESHSSKPTVFHGRKGEHQRLGGITTRRQAALFGHPGHYSLNDKFDYLAGKHKGQTKRYNAYLKAKAEHEKAHGKTGGRRRRRGSRYTRRR